MASSTSGLELKLREFFVDKAPELPEGAKKLLIEWLPILSVVFGILTLLDTWQLWHWADVANNVCQVYGVNECAASNSRFSIWVWLGIIATLVQGILYILARTGLRDRKKQGWNYVYYATLIGVAYAILGLFIDYYPLENLVWTVLISAFGLYLLFQVRSAYTNKDRIAPAATEPPHSETHKE